VVVKIVQQRFGKVTASIGCSSTHVISDAEDLGIATELIMSLKGYLLVKSFSCCRWSLCSELRASWLCLGCQILGKW
jgi:hypothetical protein